MAGCAASAFLDGRSRVHDGDLFILRHTWNNLDQREILDDVVEPIIAQFYAEHPDAYKPIEPVIASLEAAGAARRVAALTPIVNVKR